jgi:hypothetical protein
MKSSYQVFNQLDIFSRKWFPYFSVYDRHFNKFVSQSPYVLEIGIENGGSLKLWYEFFENARVYGIDNNSAVNQLKFNFPVNITVGDQGDDSFWQSYLNNSPGFDVIIDDGGHTMHQQLTSLLHLFPKLNDKGVYLIEDTHTSYWKEYGGGFREQNSIIEIIKSLVDYLHMEHIDGGFTPPEIVKNVFQGLASVHFYNSVIVLEKDISLKFVESKVSHASISIPY